MRSAPATPTASEPGRSKIVLWFALGFVLLVLNAGVSYRNINALIEAGSQVVHTEKVLKLLSEVQAYATDAETGQRGFLITGEERYLEPYLTANHSLGAKLQELRTLLADNREQVARLDQLQPLLREKLDELGQTIAVRKRVDSFSATANMVRSDVGKQLMDSIRAQIDAMQSHEEALLMQRAAEARSDSALTLGAFALATLVNLTLLGVILHVVLRDAEERRRTAMAQQESNERLAATLAQVRERNQEITLLSQMSNFLQSCANSQEACNTIARLGPQLFPEADGRLYLFHASRNYLDLAASWGDAPEGDALFAPGDCWALRRGRAHEYGATGGGLVCAHVQTRSLSSVAPYLCVPMMAQGETLGLFFLRPAMADAALGRQYIEAKQQVAYSVAEQMALALANLKLRETLRQQSIRDALTGLYNRRFLEESLDRELARLERKQQPLTVIMIDVDHFKNFNDTYGHEAGDVVLRDLGRVLRRQSRQSDIACRYGGEEFTLLLPETPLDTGRQRAESLREAVQELKLTHNGQPLGEVTLSMGVATFPDHGADRENLLYAADMALYEAKRGGRNRVVLSSRPPPREVPLQQPG
jgi:diguanylate cyclase (GGDEF)-like protein